MPRQRTDRLNSLLKEVISEVIRRDLKHVDIPELITVTRVEVSKDLRHAKVYISVIGSQQEKDAAVAVLQDNAGTITHIASKKVVLRYFPNLIFRLDEGLENQLRIEELLQELTEERDSREDHGHA